MERIHIKKILQLQGRYTEEIIFKFTLQSEIKIKTEFRASFLFTYVKTERWTKGPFNKYVTLRVRGVDAVSVTAIVFSH